MIKIETEKLSCYLSYKGSNTAKNIRKILDEMEIRVEDAYDLIQEGYFEDQTKNKIKQADFFISIYETETKMSIYEIGMAKASGKPILIINSTENDLPDFLKSNYVLSISLEEEELLRSYLQTFINKFSTLKDSRYRKERYRNITKLLSKEKAEKILSDIKFKKNTVDKHLERKLRENIIKVFDEINVISVVHHNDYSDMSIIVDELDEIIGNPILIDLKKNAIEKLSKNYLSKISTPLNTGESKAGILLDFSATNANPKVLSLNPLIICFSLEDFVNTLTEMKLPELILTLRNKKAHGNIDNG